MIEFYVVYPSHFDRFNDFGNDGGPAAKALRPKFHTFSSHVLTHTGFKVPEIEVRSAFSSYITDNR